MKKRVPDGYYDDFSILSKDIISLQSQLGRFPNKEEILSNLKIGYQYLKKHGGMYEIKRKLNIIDERNKFIDNSGFYNNSSYEMIVANFLIENNIPYLREQQIDKNHNFRSDFTFIDNNDKLIHVEVWGYLKSNKTKISLEYNKVRDIKEKLYVDNQIEYLSVEPTIFYKKNYHKMQQNLIKIFSPILLNNNLKFVKQDILIPTHEYSDQEILDIALSLSNDKEYLPEAKIFREKYMGLYNQILKRHQSYSNFGEKFNKKLLYKSNNYWSEESVFEVFDYMYNKYGYVLNRTEVNKEKINDNIVKSYSCIVASVDKMFNGIKSLKLHYFSDRLSRGMKININDVDWIKKLSINQSRRGNKLVSDELQKLATELYSVLTPTN